MTAEKSRTTDGRGRLYDNVLDAVGDTPCIRVNNLAPDHVNIYAKAEYFNPLGSVKDRLAVSIIEQAELSGDLKPGQTVVEATSGNTGIGLAMVCAAKGYPLVVTMADSFSIERRKLMRFLGAKVVLTPRAEKGMGMYKKAIELAEANGGFLARQFETDANALIHENTTAREIVADFEGKRLDYYVTGYGTGRHADGVGRVLRRASARDEDHSQRAGQRTAIVLGSGQVQERTEDGSPGGKAIPRSSRTPSRAGRRTSSRWSCRRRSISGYFDELIPDARTDGYRMVQETGAKQEGILTGDIRRLDVCRWDADR